MKRVDFTSSLYLGLYHASESLPGWQRLTSGKPAALGTPRLYQQVAHRIARLQQQEEGVLASSTLHLVWDLFSSVNVHNTALYVDADTYPILRWGAERARARGIPVRFFSAHSPSALYRLLHRHHTSDRQAWIVCDGWCTRCGKASPITQYAHVGDAFGARLVIDDTQALGILGKRPSDQLPYGYGGGGILSWNGVPRPRALLISSLAKGFGVPLAVLSGDAATLDWFRRASFTQVHSSPPAFSTVLAAAHALSINRSLGNEVRARLLARVRLFRHLLHAGEIHPRGSLFPLQTIPVVKSAVSVATHREVCRRGSTILLLRGHRGNELQLGCIIRADHRIDDIKQLAHTLLERLRTKKARTKKLLL